jgi:potassium-dependent mechanosensitive channel
VERLNNSSPAGAIGNSMLAKQTKANRLETLMQRRKFLYCLVLGTASLALTLSAGAPQVVAQVPGKAPVVFDGQVIFQVSGSGQVRAEERAELINLKLKQAVQSGEPVQVAIEDRNQQQTLLLNNRYLLTVMQSDTTDGRTANEQAQFWSQRLEQALQQSQSQRSGQYLGSAALLAGVVTAAAIALSRLLSWSSQRFLLVLKQRLTTSEQDSSSSELPPGLMLFVRLLFILAHLMLWLAALLLIANLFPFTRQWSYQTTHWLVDSFTSPVLTLNRNNYSVGQLVILVGALVGLVILSRLAANLLKSRILGATGMPRGIQEAFGVLTQYSLIFIGALVILQIWGLNLSSLTILASALGIGIGFGLQDLAKNFGSGLVLVFERPLQVGDFIQVGELYGTVERIGGRSTEIRTLDYVSIIVPNSRFLENEVINWSHGNPLSRLHLPVGVALSADPETIRTALLATVKNHSLVLDAPAPQVLFKGFGNNRLNFELLIWTKEPHRQFVLKSDLYFRVFEVFQSHQIEIPSDYLQLSPMLENALTQWCQLATNGSAAKDEQGQSQASIDAPSDESKFA